LQNLEVAYCDLVADRVKAGGIGSWSTSPGPLLGKRQLSHLSLDSCYTDAVNLVCLGTLPSLQHLSLTQMNVFSRLARTFNPLLVLCGRSSLRQHLTHLTLGNKVSTDSQPTMFAGLDSPQATTGNMTLGDAGGSLSRLDTLRELKLAGLPVTTVALQGLPALPHLTWLMLDETRDSDPNSSSSSLTGLASLTALQRLQLRSAGTLHPDVLSALHRLRYLEITDTPVSGGPQGTTAFLDTLPNLQHLSYLFWAQSQDHEWAESPQAYAALTASSMHELHVMLKGKTVTSQCPFKHMIPRPQQDPCNIRVLSLGVCDDPHICSYVAGACPALSELHIYFAKPLHDGMQQAQALQALTGLSKLSFSVLRAQKPAMAALAQLTQLEELSMAVVHRVHAEDLRLLAALTRLTKLSWTSKPKTCVVWDVVLESKVGQAVQVWHQECADTAAMSGLAVNSVLFSWCFL
jgi:hypothetical protein